jgi:hypothetical protein
MSLPSPGYWVSHPGAILRRPFWRAQITVLLICNSLCHWRAPLHSTSIFNVIVRRGSRCCVLQCVLQWVLATFTNQKIYIQINRFFSIHCMMIHKPWGFAGGDANDMRDYADLLDKMESVLIPAYAEKTGKSAEEIAAMLEDETWMNGSECVAQVCRPDHTITAGDGLHSVKTY